MRMKREGSKTCYSSAQMSLVPANLASFVSQRHVTHAHENLPRDSAVTALVNLLQVLIVRAHGY